MRAEDYWIHPDNFQYTPGQIRWLLAQLPELRKEGLSWPMPPGRETGYIGGRAKQQYYEGTLPEKGAATIGHLENLLCRQGRAGIMAKLYYSAYEDIEMIGRYFNMPSRMVEKAIDNALRRISYRVNRRS